MDAIPNLKIGVQSQAFSQARSAYSKPSTPADFGPRDAGSDHLPLRAAQTTDHVELSSSLASIGPARPTKPAGGRSLIAATVPGGVEFAPQAPIVSKIAGTPAAPAASALNPSGVYSMYRVPGEKNAAATAVSVGRALDVKG